MCSSNLSRSFQACQLISSTSCCWASCQVWFDPTSQFWFWPQLPQSWDHRPPPCPPSACATSGAAAWLGAAGGGCPACAGTAVSAFGVGCPAELQLLPLVEAVQPVLPLLEAVQPVLEAVHPVLDLVPQLPGLYLVVPSVVVLLLLAKEPPVAGQGSLQPLQHSCSPPTTPESPPQVLLQVETQIGLSSPFLTPWFPIWAIQPIYPFDLAFQPIFLKGFAALVFCIYFLNSKTVLLLSHEWFWNIWTPSPGRICWCTLPK